MSDRERDGRVASPPGSREPSPPSPSIQANSPDLDAKAVSAASGFDPIAQEEWRSVVGYEGIYEVSSLGRIRSRYAVAGHVLSPTTDKDGYPTINLYGPDGRRSFNLHRLVALAFHGDKRNALHCEVAHCDGDRTNCRADNLKWVSKVENHSHKRLHGTHQSGEKHPRARLNEEAVEEIRKSRGSRGPLATKYGISKSTVTDIRCGRRWT